MQRVLTGSDVWADLTPMIKPGRRRRVAIAYVTLADVLPLRRGDLAVIDAEDATVAAGGTDPRIVGRWLRQGIDVRSYPGLHAKVMVTDRIAAVGSANASGASVKRHREGVLVTDDADIRRAVRQFIDGLATNAEALDEEWVRRTIPLFGTARKPAAGRPRRRPGSVLPAKVERLQLVPVVSARPAPEEVTRAVSERNDSARRAGLPVRFLHDWLEMSRPHDFRATDLICRVEGNGADRLVEAPGQIIDIVAPSRRRKVWLVLLRDTTLPAVAWDDLLLAVGGDGRSLPLELWLRRPHILDAVLGQWGLTVT